MLFSQRHGLTPLRKQLQVEDVDQELRNRLWNVFKKCYWDNIIQKNKKYYGYPRDVEGSVFAELIFEYWHSFFKVPIDLIPERLSDSLSVLRKYFFSCPWNNVYDFIEFTLSYSEFDDIGETTDFLNACNLVLEEENAGYRIIARQVVPITSVIEIDAVEQALANSDAFSGVKIHLETAVKHLADRKNPDYRNSIKESISAVESACQVLTADSKATLGSALSVLEKQTQLHGALKAGFSKLYGYTSDAEGIRHALLEASTVSFSDAKFMLVACSGFINYLVGKMAELGVEPGKDT